MCTLEQAGNMPPSPKRIREQAVVYLSQRDRELLEKLASTTGLSRTELFRRGLWALAAQTLDATRPSAFEQLIAGASDELPADLSEHADEYLYGGKYQDRERKAVAESPEPKPSARKRHSAKRARPR